MKPKTIRIAYWVAISLLALLMLMDGYGGISQDPTGQEVMRHLGYPLYVLYIFGAAKILGAIAILQGRFPVLKEWAFAGFAFNFIGALASRAFVGDGGMELIFPIIGLIILFVPYYLWKRYQRGQLAR